MTKRSRLLPALALSLSLLAACGSPPQAGDSAGPAAGTSAAAAVPSGNPAPSTSARPEPARPGTGSSGAPANAAPPAPATQPPAAGPRPALPSKLLIPSIHVDAPVEHVGTTADGAMDVPHEPNDVAWFNLGYRPGERGSAVIAGHLDSATDRAVFWDLRLLKQGDKVLLKAEDGSQLTFRVSGSEVYPYNQAPLQKIFGAADQPMLNLVTCNGVFDRGNKNYDKRLVVYAKEAA
ncbi:MAG TPA: class F sortase [Chloroflexota bacterium]|jgi:LPXTG-site transpeptidase (sortase) family protein